MVGHKIPRSLDHKLAAHLAKTTQKAVLQKQSGSKESISNVKQLLQSLDCRKDNIESPNLLERKHSFRATKNRSQDLTRGGGQTTTKNYRQGGGGPSSKRIESELKKIN